MREDRGGNVLSDDPRDLEGAQEWTRAEIERMEREEEDSIALTIEMRPYIERAQRIRAERLANAL